MGAAMFMIIFLVHMMTCFYYLIGTVDEVRCCNAEQSQSCGQL